MGGYGVFSRNAASNGAIELSARDLEQRFGRRIMVVAVSRLGDRTAAEDAAQETLKRIVEALHAGRIRNLEALPAFVHQTVRHVCQQYWRKFEREGRALGRFAAEPVRTANKTPLASLIDDERRKVVRKALARLSEEDRELLRLLYYEELELQVVAERLELTNGAVRVRKHRALRRLCDLLGDASSREGNKDRRSAT